MTSAYPIELNLSGRWTLVVGLGKVGRRKAAGLLAAGARVVGLDPAATDQTAGEIAAEARVQAGGGAQPGLELEADSELKAGSSSSGASSEQGSLLILREPYHKKHLSGKHLAITAASAEVNRAVVADAKQAGVLVSTSSEPEQGDFALPAVWRSGPLVLSVSTSGASPGLSAWLRDRAAESLPLEAAAALASILADLRSSVLAQIPDAAVRRRLLARWASPDWLARLEAEGAAATVQALRADLERVVAESGQGDGAGQSRGPTAAES
jgi:siroheme synthase-like protein